MKTQTYPIQPETGQRMAQHPAQADIKIDAKTEADLFQPRNQNNFNQWSNPQYLQQHQTRMKDLRQ